jgi:hypothetical protein
MATEYGHYMITDTGSHDCPFTSREHLPEDQCREQWVSIANPRCGQHAEHQEIHYWTGEETGSRCECGAKRRPLNWGKPWCYGNCRPCWCR